MKKVRDTSKKAYHSNVKQRIPRQYFLIKKAIEEIDDCEGVTRGEIARHLKMEKSTISARVNEMLKIGYLVESGKRKDKHSGITSYTVKIVK